LSRPQPRYRQVADQLRGEIASGRLKPGGQIPTEMELCASFEISRHTAREALRLLTEDGLIERRRGAGSVVLETSGPAFAQPIGDYDAILQYARDAHFTPRTAAPATDEMLVRHGLTGAYVCYRGMRQVEGQAPIALTHVFARADIAPPLETVNALDTSLSEWVEASHGISVAKVVQRMEAVALDAKAADALGVAAGSPALRTVRRYRDGAEAIILLSESLHPAGRFAYEMRLDRKR